ncbi:PepSY domain-containing protein [Paracoccus fistulariae]|uniref:PepSY domain-containing protein n=1 Tax=Paracoccus fistulariae TaxID=658446 RepID=A0ABY7SL85_9RHOB|nr:hypothetical protein [Paracoccus fistulariae]MDB6182542.1 hypothetical protein [Paracoccus fistulariae]WCR07754.1 hypothetical protein JHX87_02650 [Paracoccus fistulariae]
MRRYLSFLLIPAMLALPLAAQDLSPVPQEIQQFRPLPFHEMARKVGARYAGRMIAAQIQPPTEQEHQLGAALVYEFRLVTPQRNLLIVRMDARDGRFLDVGGRGQLAAQRKPGKRRGKN